MNETTTAQNHPLHTSWTVWYHSPLDNNWGYESYKDVLEIHTLEDFFVLKNTWSKCLPLSNEGMYFMMRKTPDGTPILPLWEDSYNRKGGYWSYKLDKEHAQEVWFQMMAFAIGEYLVTDEANILEINGISISPKKNFCVLKIWNRNASFHQSHGFLNPSLKKLIGFDDLMYSSHDENIIRDQNTKQKYGQGQPNHTGPRFYTPSINHQHKTKHHPPSQPSSTLSTNPIPKPVYRGYSPLKQSDDSIW